MEITSILVVTRHSKIGLKKLKRLMVDTYTLANYQIPDNNRYLVFFAYSL